MPHFEFGIVDLATLSEEHQPLVEEMQSFLTL